MTLHPELLWAQRSSASDEAKNVVYLTVNTPDIQANTLEYSLETQKIFFKAKSGNAQIKEYTFNLDLFGEILPEKSSKTLTARSLYLVLHKKEQKVEYWPRLTREKVKNGQIRTDFNKWVDSDEQSIDVKDDEDLEAAWSMPSVSRTAALKGGDGMPWMNFEQ
ncbi:HSP20-like chaperone [Mycena olivaceomarginata]|nr:HSP20-like chaperone [Mycena olivaceomarginata]